MAAKGKSKIADKIIFALDIGTRSIIGIVGIVEDDRFKVIAIEREEHTRRAMIDGQIEDIEQVAKLAGIVKKRLESKLGFTLKRVSIAAAGRALLTQRGSYELTLPEARKINPEIISRLEAGAINQAEEAFSTMERPDEDRQFFLVGYSVLTYTLDNYNFSTILDHKGKQLKADIIATFLPSEVVDSLYTAMNKIGLEVASLTLEPIAAINASIPQDLRLLNLVMVDIGAGTSDIAACRDGGIIGYTMATLAGDEITEALMKQYLVDFKTAENLKFGLTDEDSLIFKDILGFEHTVKRDEILECVKDPLQSICQEIAKQIVDLNNGAPSAVFLAGGGSKMVGLREGIVENLNMDDKRVAIVGNNFALSAFSDEYDLNNPEYATPLGIAISAGLNLINDSFQVTLNNRPAKLFKSGVFTIMDVLMMNGYGYKDLVSRSGRNIVVELNGRRVVFHGEPSSPAVLKLNGENTKMTQLIRAGDSIEFQPAVCGRDAEAVLGDLVKPGYKSLRLNGLEVSLNTPLNTGDVILAEEESLPDVEDGQLSSPMDEDENDLLSDMDNEEWLWDQALEDGMESRTDAAGGNEKTRPSVTEPVTARHETAPESSDDSQTGSSAVRSGFAPAQPRPVSGQVDSPAIRASSDSAQPRPVIKADSPAAASSNMHGSPTKTAAFQSHVLHITLNDIPLDLPPKSDDSAYLLMDILERSGLDFQNISGQVILTVNGESATFLQKLHNHDIVVIRCES